MTLDDVVIFLNRPSEAGNVGAVCRSMKNCGLARLAIAAPEGNILNEQGIIKTRSVHAGDIWDKRKEYISLIDSTKDFSLLIATSRRRGKKRGVTLPAHDLAEYLQKRPSAEKPVALVFGNERTGLETEEIALCSISSHIPANDVFPSFNLSHAVQIYAYEIFCALSEAAKAEVSGTWKPAGRAEIETLCAAITADLSRIGFYTQVDSDFQQQFFRDVFSRAGLTESELKYTKDIFAKITHIKTHT